MGWFRDFVFKLLKIRPASERRITIEEPLTFRANVLQNKIWYRGDPAELTQFFRQTAAKDTDTARFWASVPFGKVRKIHSGIVSIVVDRYKDIITADMDAVDFGEPDDIHPIADTWQEIAKDCDFNGVLGDAIAGALSSSDGAFKISIDAQSPYPIVEFYEADNVEFVMKGRKTTAIKFYTPYRKDEKEYRLEEEYGIGYVRYRLFSEDGKQVEMSEVEEVAGLKDTTFNGDFMMAVPLVIFRSGKWKGRGKALFDSKTDALDALDEVISQWLDAVRMGRVKRYIPEDMVPRDPNTGQLIEANPFDNDFIAVGSMKTEGAQDKIDVSQPQISYEAYVNSYASFMDLVLQGIMSPATLGIDLKKTDNAEAQREKEKVTLHVRGKIVDALNDALPLLIERIMKTNDLIHGPAAKDYEVSVKFGEYASPDFGSTVETVVKAKQGGVMSIEQSVEELYGDTWTREDKDAEIARLKAEQGIIDMDEPAVNLDGLPGEEDQVAGNEGGAQDGNGSDRKTGISDERKAGESAPGAGQ
ncbi:MAG: phage portal protein [Lachnospiraceae bacterium]|nr:phage portal protein [Lachnospiraceae bacterium]